MYVAAPQFWCLSCLDWWSSEKWRLIVLLRILPNACQWKSDAQSLPFGWLIYVQIQGIYYQSHSSVYMPGLYYTYVYWYAFNLSPSLCNFLIRENWFEADVARSITLLWCYSYLFIQATDERYEAELHRKNTLLEEIQVRLSTFILQNLQHGSINMLGLYSYCMVGWFKISQSCFPILQKIMV